MIPPKQRKEFDEKLKSVKIRQNEKYLWEIGCELPDGEKIIDTFYGTEDGANDALNDLLDRHKIKLFIYPVQQ